MAKIKEYYQVGNRDEITKESLLVLLEDMYKTLALAINSNTSYGEVIASARLNAGGGFLGTPYNIASSTHPTTGRYVVTFSTPQADANYVVVATAQASSGFKFIATILKCTTTNFIVQIWDDGGNFRTPTSVSVIVAN